MALRNWYIHSTRSEGEFSERYRDHTGRYKKNAALKGLSKRALQERAFEESNRLCARRDRHERK